MLRMLLESITYYFLFPILLSIIIYILYKEKRDITALADLDNKDKVVKKSLKKSYSRIKKLEALFVIVLILSMPIMFVVSSDYTNTMAHKEERGGTSVWGRFFPILDPVKFQIGPTRSLDVVKERMNKLEGVWHPELLMEKIDLERLARYPGKFTLYRLMDDRVVVIYQYMTPVPIFKTFGISICYVDGEIDMLVMKEDTITYPQRVDQCSTVFVD